MMTPSTSNEEDLWNTLKPTAEAALMFWSALLELRENGTEKLSVTSRDRVLRIIRAVSWVESRHGTGAGNHPDRDPMQCGNPADAWWPQLAGLSGDGDRYIGGPGARNYWARELPSAAAAETGFPKSAKLSELADKTKGHRDAGFNPTMSINWGVPHLVWKTNVPAGRKTYNFGEITRESLIAGAVAYNGGGDPSYGQKIDAALVLGGWKASVPVPHDEFHVLLDTTLRRTSEMLEMHAAAGGDLSKALEKARIEVTRDRVTIEFGGRSDDRLADIRWATLTERTGEQRIAEAKRLLKEGKTYSKGCSEFVCQVLGVPYEVANDLIGEGASSVGSRPPYNGLAPGDIAGWTNDTGMGHVAVYVGESDQLAFIDVREPGAKPRSKNAYYDHELFKSKRF